MNNFKTFLLLLLSILLPVAAACTGDNEPEGAIIKEGDKLPAFSVAISDGTVFSTSHLTGKTAVIVLFNIGCGDCRTELPQIQCFVDKSKDIPSVVTVAIAREESRDKIEKYWNENHFTIPFAPQSDRAVYSLFANNGIPRVYVATNGIVTAAYEPQNPPTCEELLKAARIAD